MGMVSSLSALSVFLLAPPATPGTPAAASPTPAAPAAPAQAPSRVAVIAAGAEAPELQRFVEQGLVSPDIVISGVLALAPLVGIATPPKTLDPANEKQAQSLLEAAKAAYFEGRNLDALENLGALAALQERDEGFSRDARVTARLWRASAALALDDAARADKELIAALSLNPDLVVDLNEFRPTLRDRVDSLRATAVKAVTVTVGGLPVGAVVSIDGVAAAAKFRTTAGSHVVGVSAPGVRSASRTIELKGDTTVHPPLALALTPAADAAVVAAATAGTAGDAEVAELRRRTAADYLVLAAGTAAAAKLVVISADGRRTWSAPAGSAAAAGAFARRTVLEQRKAVEPPGAVSSGGTQISVAAGPVWAARSFSLSDEDGTRYEAGFAGGGVRASVLARYHILEGVLEAEQLSLAMKTLRVHSDGGTQALDGGDRTSVALLGGVRWFGSRDREGLPTVTVRTGVTWTRLAANDVTVGGDALGLLPSHTRTALVVAAGGRYPLAIAGTRVALDAELRAGVLGTYSETPKGATGGDPTVGLDAAWTAGVSWEPRRSRMSVRAAYDGSRRDVAFEGTGGATIEPALQDARVAETVQSGRVEARWRF